MSSLGGRLAGYIEGETCLRLILRLWVYFTQGLRQLSLIQTLVHICPQVSLGPNRPYIISKVRTVGLSSTLESNPNHATSDRRHCHQHHHSSSSHKLPHIALHSAPSTATRGFILVEPPAASSFGGPDQTGMKSYS